MTPRQGNMTLLPSEQVSALSLCANHALEWKIYKNNFHFSCNFLSIGHELFFLFLLRKFWNLAIWYEIIRLIKMVLINFPFKRMVREIFAKKKEFSHNPYANPYVALTPKVITWIPAPLGENAECKSPIRTGHPPGSLRALTKLLSKRYHGEMLWGIPADSP